MIAIGVSTQALAQDEWDALRYSRLAPAGTARTQSIGGAAGSLGGDISATHVNPAGLGFYKTSEVVITPGFYFNKIRTGYLGTGDNANRSGVTLGNAGIIFGLPARNNGKWKNMAVALNYSRLADFNSTIKIRGVNSSSSITDRWAEDLNNGGRPVTGDEASSGFPTGASLGYRNYLVSLANDGNYHSYVPVDQGIYQQDMVEQRGGMNEFSIGLGGNYNDQLYIGAALNFPTIRYERNRTYAEDDNTDDTGNEFSFLEYKESLKTDAVGFNAKLGLIYSPMPALRIGLAYHTPSWYSMRDQSTANLQNDLEGFQPDPSNPIRYPVYIESGEINDGFPLEYEYKLRTPSRALVSLSYIFGTNADVSKQHGFITADVEYVNYGGTKYNFSKGPNPQTALANSLNEVIRNTYQGAMNLRVGGELKFTVLAVRAGFSYYGSPYKQADIDGSIKKISGGLGYRNKGFFADLTYIHTLSWNDMYQPYILRATNVQPASLETTGGNVMATIGFKF